VKLYAGIDGGQTSTTAVVGDERGTVLGRGAAGPADEVGCDAGSTRLKDALEGALAAALDDAGLPPDARLTSVVAGVSGYAGRIAGRAPAFAAETFALVHDAPIAHAGAFGGGPGVVVIAGTGSVVYGVAADGRAMMAGGLGYVFGDEGSAFGIARAAIRRADASDALRERVRAFFAVDSALQVARTLYAGAIGRDRIAAFAHALLDDPDEEVQTLLDAELAALASQIQRVRAALDVDAVAAIGGMTKSAYYLTRLQREVPLVEPKFAPVVGALILARARGAA